MKAKDELTDIMPELEKEFGEFGSKQWESSMEEARSFYTGQMLRDLRKEAKVTQSELASRLNVTKSYISRIENGLITPSVTVFYSIIESLGMRVEIIKPVV